MNCDTKPALNRLEIDARSGTRMPHVAPLRSTNRKQVLTRGFLAETEGFEPSVPFKEDSTLAGWCTRPLCDVSRHPTSKSADALCNHNGFERQGRTGPCAASA